MIDPDETLFEELISEELAAVTFVRDYVQLQFGSPPTLNAYTPVTVRSQGTASRSGDSGFAQALVGQLDKKVLAVRKEPSQRLEILFDDASAIEISFDPRTTTGPKRFNILQSKAPCLSSKRTVTSAVTSPKEAPSSHLRCEFRA